MLQEINRVDRVEVLQPSRIVQVRMVNEILRDDVVVASSYSRYVLEPGADLTGEPVEVARICAAVWV